MAVAKRTYGFDEFSDKLKLSESIEEIGFRSTHEYEDDAVDTLGTGEKVESGNETSEEPSTGEEAPVVNAAPEAEIPAAPEDTTSLDTGNREDVSVDEVKVKMDYINGILKNMSNLLAQSDKVPLDSATKERIIKLYNIIQGI